MIRWLELMVAYIRNPLPGRPKVQRNGRYVLDVRGRIKSWFITRRELKRRILAGEEEQKCFRIGLKGETDFYGKTG